MRRKTFVLRGRGEPETLRVEGRAGAWTVFRGTENAPTQTVRLPDGRISVLLSDGRQFCGRVTPRARGEIEISSARGACRLSLADPLHDRVDHAMSSSNPEDDQEEVRALMPGRVIEVAVAPGQAVEKGALLLVIEAMKMQNEIRAERAGVIQKVSVRAGETVEGGSGLLTVQGKG